VLSRDYQPKTTVEELHLEEAKAGNKI